MYTEEPIVILVPTDPDRIALLRKKLDDYRRRAEKQGIFYKAPEAMDRNEADTYYKLLLTSRLIVEKREVQTFMMFTELGGETIVFKTVFYNACSVIADYVETGGQRTIPKKTSDLPPPPSS